MWVLDQGRLWRAEVHGALWMRFLGFCPGYSLLGSQTSTQYIQGGPRRPDERLTLHMQHDGGLSMSGRASGVADVLAGVLLGYPGDDQCVTFQLVLPG